MPFCPHWARWNFAKLCLPAPAFPSFSVFCSPKCENVNARLLPQLPFWNRCCASCEKREKKWPRGASLVFQYTIYCRSFTWLYERQSQPAGDTQIYSQAINIRRKSCTVHLILNRNFLRSAGKNVFFRCGDERWTTPFPNYSTKFLFPFLFFVRNFHHFPPKERKHIFLRSSFYAVVMR